MTSIPVIDLEAGDGVVARDLRAAYGEVGFAYLVGHGVSDALIESTFALSRHFHALPLVDKMAIELNDRHRGYIAINTSTDRNSELAAVTEPNQSASFMMMTGDYLAGANQWPDLEGFRSGIECYHEALMAVAVRVIDAMMAALGEPAAPSGAFDRPTTWLRLLHYPPSDAGHGVYGSAPHVDYGAITLLAQDDVGGLQVQDPTGDWIDVPPRRGAFVLNTGSLMRRWSNDRLRATPHRVINRSAQQRYSIPFFFDPHPDTVVAPLPSCVSAGRPARYEPLLVGDFLAAELRVGYDRHAET